jgi:hypothetical protein
MNTPGDCHPEGCEIVIPIVLKLLIYVEPIVLETPTECHPSSSVETSCSIPVEKQQENQENLPPLDDTSVPTYSSALATNNTPATEVGIALIGQSLLEQLQTFFKGILPPWLLHS